MSKFVLVDIKTKGPIKTDLSYISGSTIRGTYINSYINQNNIKEDISLNEEYRSKLLSNSVRFFDAYPKFDENYSIPTPLCFYASKDNIKKFSRDKNPIKIVNEFKDEVKEGYQRVNKSEFSIIKDKQLNLVSINKVENLHNCKQIDDENIYRYEAIDKNQKFYTIIQCDDELADEVKKCLDKQVLYIGGSKSSGYGRCEVEVRGIFDYKEIKEKYYNVGLDNNIKIDKVDKIHEGKKILNIFFQSDTIILDEGGNLVPIVPEELLEVKLGICDVKLIKASVISKDVKGYNAMWKCKVPNVTSIKSGSMITYSYNGELDKDKIEKLEIQGIGIKKNEGYGRIFINPKFDVKECAVYKAEKVTRQNVKLTGESEILMKNMMTNIVKDREDEYVTCIVVQSLDAYSKSYSGKSISLDQFPNSQKGRLLNVIVDAIDEKNEDESKQKIIDFKKSLKTKTKELYEDKSKCKVFDFSLYKYLDKLVSNESLKDITGTDLKLVYPNLDKITYQKSSDYEMKLKLTKKILEYKIREKGGKK
ncbi:RAMP superfamily CRISPR-associated protein [Intestinibacter sp.]